MAYRLMRRLADASLEKICCPACMETMTLDHFKSSHAETVHGCGPSSCAFCLGRYEFTRGTIESKSNAKHCLECLESFLHDNAVPTPCQECTSFRPHPRNMRGRLRLDDCDSIYDVSEFHRPEWWPSVNLLDESKGLHNDVTGIFRRFREGDLKWFHLMVRHDVYETFRREMLEIRQSIAVLPYSCLCDGQLCAVHRHMILACETDSDFPNVWRDKVGNSKHLVEIKTLPHLARCIQYVSQYRSSCNGKRINDNKLISDVVEDVNSYSHFYLDRHLPSHGIAWMSTLFPGGVKELLKAESRNKSMVDWVDKAVKIRDELGRRRWAIKVKDMGSKYLNCVVPVRRDLEPVR